MRSRYAGKSGRDHIKIAETILGRSLKGEEQVHHVDGNGKNNTHTDFEHTNLVICPTAAYHKLLHIRANALLACGDVNKRRCYFCGQYDDPQKMKNPNGEKYFHKKCKNTSARRLHWTEKLKNDSKV